MSQMAQFRFSFDPVKILLAIVCAALIMALISTCQTAKILESQVSDLTNNQNKLFKRIKNDSLTLYTQAATIMQQNAANEVLKGEAARLELARIDALAKVKTKTIVKTEFELGETVYIDSFPHLKLPRTFGREGKWLSIGGTINRLGRLQIDSIIIPVNYSVAIGDTLRKGFLFRKRDKVVRISVDNPYVNITGVNNVIVEDRKKWYETGAAQFGLGLILGAVIVTALK